MVGSPPSEHDRLVSLLRERSLQIGTFRLASGKTSNYYVDARRTTMSSAGLQLIGSLGLHAIREALWKPRIVGGLTLGADPISYAIAMASQLDPPAIDAFTVRKEPKQHGTGRQIEGCFVKGVRTVIVEDVITTGDSALTAARVLQDAGADIAGVLAVVDRQEGGRQAIEGAGFEVTVLVTLEDLGIGISHVGH